VVTTPFASGLPPNNPTRGCLACLHPRRGPPRRPLCRLLSAASSLPPPLSLSFGITCRRCYLKTPSHQSYAVLLRVKHSVIVNTYDYLKHL
jgi:hypothetical protein